MRFLRDEVPEVHADAEALARARVPVGLEVLRVGLEPVEAALVPEDSLGLGLAYELERAALLPAEELDLLAGGKGYLVVIAGHARSHIRKTAPARRRPGTVKALLLLGSD